MADLKERSATLRKVLKYVRCYWPALIISLVLSLVYVAMSLYIPILVGQSIKYVFSPRAASSYKLLLPFGEYAKRASRIRYRQFALIISAFCAIINLYVFIWMKASLKRCSLLFLRLSFQPLQNEDAL